MCVNIFLPLHMQQLKSQRDVAKLFDTPQKSIKNDKENIIVGKKKSSTLTTSTKKSNVDSIISTCKRVTRSASQLLKSKQASSSRQPSKSPSRPSTRSMTREKSERSSKSPPPSTRASSRKVSSQSSQSPSEPDLRELQRSQQSSKSPPPSPPKASVVPGSCKQFPFILSSGESDHEVPLPSTPAQKLLEKQSLRIGLKRGQSNEKQNVDKCTLPPDTRPKSSDKPSVKPFQVKSVGGSTLSSVNPLAQTKAKEGTAKPKASASLPSTAKQPDNARSVVSRVAKKETKEIMDKPKPSTSLSSTAKQPNSTQSVVVHTTKKPAISASYKHPPVSKPHLSTTAYKPVKKPSSVVRNFPPPPPPPPRNLYSDYYPSTSAPSYYNHRVVSSHDYVPATGHQYYLSQPHHSMLNDQRYVSAPSSHHHLVQYPPRHYYNSSNSSYSGSQPLAAHHHPLTNSYSASYYNY